MAWIVQTHRNTIWDTDRESDVCMFDATPGLVSQKVVVVVVSESNNRNWSFLGSRNVGSIMVLATGKTTTATDTSVVFASHWFSLALARDRALSLSLPLFRSVFLTLVVCPLLFPVLVDTYRPTTHNFAFPPWWSLWWETKVETSDDAVDKKWLREHQPYLSVRQQHHK